ncbi:hypothetical protein IFR05_008756, partial [Cadophora sp. M221]
MSHGRRLPDSHRIDTIHPPRSRKVSIKETIRRVKLKSNNLATILHGYDSGVRIQKRWSQGKGEVNEEDVVKGVFKGWFSRLR